MPRLAAATYEPVRTYKCVQGVKRWPPASGWPAKAAAPPQDRLAGAGAAVAATDKEPPHWRQQSNAELTLLTRRAGVSHRAGAGNAAAAPR